MEILMAGGGLNRDARRRNKSCHCEVSQMLRSRKWRHLSVPRMEERKRELQEAEMKAGWARRAVTRLMQSLSA